MIFKVKWGDIQGEFKKKLNTGDLSPIKAYFEDNNNLLTFINGLINNESTLVFLRFLLLKVENH